MNVPHPEIGRNFVEIGSYLPGVLGSERRQNSEKYLAKNVKKGNFQSRFWSKNVKILLKFIRILFSSGPNAQGFGGILVSFTCPMKITPQILMRLHVSTNFRRFSPKISRIFMRFSIIYLRNFIKLFW